MKFDSLSRIDSINCPKLFIHAEDDEIVPFSMGRQLFDAAGYPKDMLVIKGGHNEGFLDAGGRYSEAIRKFVHAR